MKRGTALLTAVLLCVGVAAATWLTRRPSGVPAQLPPAGSAASPVSGDRALLQRWAPVLRLDRREPSGPVSVEAFAAAATRSDRALELQRPPVGPAVLHGHAVRDGGRLWLQYWALWADNPQDRGVLRTGRHQGDWEVVQVALDRALRPAAATFAQHSWAVGCPADGELDVWVAHGSHASHPRRRDGDRPWPDPTDEVRGDGAVLRPAVIGFGDWVDYAGRWGATRAGWVPGESSSPPGPAFQGSRFRRPAAFHAAARACTALPPAWPWWVRAAACAAVAAGLLYVASGFSSKAPFLASDAT